MFQTFDKPPTEGSSSRAAWMALLARAPLALLEQGLQVHLLQRRTEWLRQPETGLYMVQGRAGATGQRFNLGELTVTRCALRAPTQDQPRPPVGVAYVLGRSHRHAELAAWADALLQEAGPGAELEQTLLVPVRAHLAQQQAQRRAQAQASKVDFFTLAREAGASDEGEGEQ